MIIFPLITTWMWFQIITASPLPSWAVWLKTALTLTPRCFQSECHWNDVEHDQVLFPLLQHEEDFRDYHGVVLTATVTK